jgi:Uma2 family endonuclease
MGTTTLLTFEEFERLPDEPGKLELLDGDLIRMPPPELDHMEIAHRLYDLLKPVLASGLGRPYIETGYQIGDNWVVPDVSITHPAQGRTKYLQGAPALAIEVVSPSNTAQALDRKRKLYLENGGVEVWVVYPKTESVFVFGHSYVEEFHETLRSRLVPNLEIDLRALFAAA